jgi:HEPN domain-containing protein
MPHDRMAPDNPGEWLNRARSDLALAKARVDGVYLEDLCYHAQQAAEKAFKALLLSRVKRFPYVHDLALLVGEIEQAGITVPGDVREAVTLSEYAVEGRYPGFDEPVTAEQRERECLLAQRVVEWVSGLVEQPVVGRAKQES